MHSASVAQWLIARFTTQSRAAATVGDLLEASHGKGIVRFWLSVGSVLLPLAWRPLLAFAAAFCLGVFSFAALQNLIYGVNAIHRPPHEWILLFDFLTVSGVLLSFGMPYTTIRYELRDPFTQLILTFWGLTSLLILFWWIPVVPAACGVLAGLSLAYSARSAPRRRAFVAFVVALALSFAGAAFLSRSLTTALYLVPYHVNSRSALSHTTWTALKRLAFATFWLGWIIQPCIYSHVRDLFFPKKSLAELGQPTV